MYIRRTTTRRSTSGETYFTYRLVESFREGPHVRQRTLLNLGRHFDLPEDQWPLLCQRLEDLRHRQASGLPLDLPERVEALAQTLAGQLVARAAAPAAGPEYAEVDVHSLELSRPRSVGVEQVGLYALSQLGLEAILTDLGVNAVTRGMILAQIVGRMAHPGSERSTWQWLNDTSALDELLVLSFAERSSMRLYRAADVLLKHQAAIEARVFQRVQDLFELDATVTLYDLTNTYFEGVQDGNPEARRGHSKEKRTDCPLVTLGLVLDGSGCVRRSRVFAGNAVEWRTLEAMLTGLNAPAGALVVMDRGIATAANLTWLRAHGYRYLVVSREAQRKQPEGSVTLTTAGGDTLTLEKVVDTEAREVRLYCHSPRREAKERGISERFCTRFEEGLAHLAEGLTQPRGQKRPEKIQERIGRLRQRCRGAGQHYTVTVDTNPEGTRVTQITYTRQPVAGSMLAEPGVYCLRATETDWSEEQLWRTYVMLTDLEAVFRSLKSELGLRPVFHSKDTRTQSHLFISVLAYQCVQIIRRKLKAHGIDLSWASLREILSVQRRVTASFTQRDGRTLHLRQATQPEGLLATVYHLLGVDPRPGGTKKVVV